MTWPRSSGRELVAISVTLAFHTLLLAALLALRPSANEPSESSVPPRIALARAEPPSVRSPTLPEAEPPTPTPRRALAPVPAIPGLPLHAAPLETGVVLPPVPFHPLPIEPPGVSHVRSTETAAAASAAASAAPSAPSRARTSELRTDTGPVDAKGVDVPPREFPTNHQPDYPASARRQGREGYVRVRIDIDARGEVEEVRTLAAEGVDAFRQSVQRAVGRWRFTPAMHEGRAIPVFAEKTFHFQLQGGP
ncbi:MAG: TonB family protein [Planctomycetaceae bacterium]|nr:TonB family protein [Planctomycetaceae bacterium]